MASGCSKTDPEADSPWEHLADRLAEVRLHLSVEPEA